MSMNTIRDFFIEDAKRIRAEIRAKMPEGCEMDEIDWLQLEQLKERHKSIMGQTFPEGLGSNFLEVKKV